MVYLLSTFWLWLLPAALLGLVVGWLTCRRGGVGWGGIVPWLALLAGGIVIAALRILPDRPGFWFDLGVMMVALYLLGCGIGCLVGRMGAGDEPAAAKRIEPARELAVEPMAKAATPFAMEEPVGEAITGLSGPRGGKGDDLKRIYGVDAGMEGKLNGLGLYHYDQIAALTPGQRRWLFRQLGHAGRFPSWWWRWRYDAELLAAGKDPLASSAPSPQQPDGSASAAKKPEGEIAGTKPKGLEAPRGGKGDDLKRIRGIGKQNEGRLHGLGIWHFDQISTWTKEEAEWVGGYLAFPGRIEREDWIGQAKVLAAGGVTDFAKRADAGLVPTSRDDADYDGGGNIATPGKDFGDKPKKPQE